MTHFCYVRIQAQAPSGPVSFGTPILRVMPARIFLIGVLLHFLPAQGQSFLHVTCDSACQPAFSAVPDDVTIGCGDDFPAFELPDADGCPDAAVENVPHVELDVTGVTSHSAVTAMGDGPDWALWLGGFQGMGFGASDYFIPTGGGIIFEQFANGTARFTGEMVNDTDPDQRFALEVYLQYGQDYESWTAQGRLPKDDLGLGAYPDWTFYEVVDTLSHLTGLGDYEGDMLYLDHMPVTRLFGFQVGELGANNRNTNYGVSGWFWYRGMIGGQPVMGTGDVNADLVDAATSGVECPVVEELHRVAMAWSACGHHEYEQVLQRLDEEAPVFISLPPLESASCTSLPDTADISAFEVFDACGSALSLTNVDSVAGEPCNQVAYRTWTLTDACGNSTDTVQSVALVDITGPTFELADTTIVCDEWDNYEAFVPEFSDDCSPSESISWSFADSITSGFYPIYFTMDRVYTAVDLCGNATVDTMVIAVIDTVAPIWIFLPPDTTILCDEWADYTIIQPIATDNCDPNPIGPPGSGATDTTITDGECIGEFTVELTFEFADMSGNVITYVQIIEAVDTIPPTFPYFPADTTLDCSEDWPAPTDAAIWMATAEDNFCPFDLIWEDSVSTGACLGNDTLFRTFTAIDDCQNMTSQTQVIVRIDTVGPVLLSAPGDTTLACGVDFPSLDLSAEDNCGNVDSVWITVDTLDVAYGDAVSTGFEDCSLDGFVATGGSISISNDAFDGSCAVTMLHAAGEPQHNFHAADIMAGRGTYRVMARADGFISDNMVELLAGDATSSEALRITLRPLGTDNPGISVSGFGVDVATDATMQQGEWYEVIAVLGETTLSVSVDGTSVLEVDLPADLPEQGRFKLAAAYSGSYDDMSYVPEDPCPVVERYIRTVYAMDDCGNMSSASQVIEKIDTVAPMITFLPEDAAIDCTDPWPLPEESDEWMALAEDACTEVTVTWSDEIVPNACPGSSTLYRTFTATDACGNQTSAMQTITQSDTEAPQLDPATLPADVLVECDAIPAVLDSTAFGVTDNCNDWTFGAGSEIIEGACQYTFTRVDTYTFTDCDGNATEFVHTVDVQDVTPPSFLTFPEDASIPCTQDFPMPTDGDEWMATAEDNCGMTTVTWEDEVMPNACPGSSTLHRTFTAVDECGNATSQMQTITQYDDEAPELNEDLLPEDMLVNCDEVPAPLDSLAFEVTDNCNAWSFSVMSDTTEMNPCGFIYTRVDTYTFTDCDGNATQFVHTVEVQDTTPPSFLFVPSDDAFACTEEYPMPMDAAEWLATAEDNCSGLEVTWSDEIVDGPCLGVDTLHRTFTATDACGNASTVEQVMFRFDNFPPVPAFLPNDTVLDCGSEPATLDSSAFLVTDVCYDEWTFSVETEYDGDPTTSCFFTRYDTYTFTDCSGNDTVFVHVISVQDTTGPNIDVGPANLFLDCPQDVPQFDTNAALDAYADLVEDLSISDACNGDLSVLSATYEDVVTVSVDAWHYTMTRSWTFYDQCGNSTTYDQTIQVDEPDLELPNAFSPGGNGFNDTYIIGNLGTVDEGDDYYPPCEWGGDGDFVYFRVFNRWGNLVYESPAGEPYRNDWDGRTTSGTDQSVVDGTYFVLLQLGDGRQWGSYVDVRND